MSEVNIKNWRCNYDFVFKKPLQSKAINLTFPKNSWNSFKCGFSFTKCTESNFSGDYFEAETSRWHGFWKVLMIRGYKVGWKLILLCVFKTSIPIWSIWQGILPTCYWWLSITIYNLICDIFLVKLPQKTYIQWVKKSYPIPISCLLIDLNWLFKKVEAI